MLTYQYGILLNLSSDHSYCQQSSTVVTPQVFSTVINRVRPSKPVVDNHRRLHMWYDAKVEQ